MLRLKYKARVKCSHVVTVMVLFMVRVGPKFRVSAGVWVTV